MHRVDRLEDENDELKAELERLRAEVRALERDPQGAPFADQAARVLDQLAALSERRPRVGIDLPADKGAGPRTGSERALTDTGPVDAGAVAPAETLVARGAVRAALAPPVLESPEDSRAGPTWSLVAAACVASVIAGMLLEWWIAR